MVLFVSCRSGIELDTEANPASRASSRCILVFGFFIFFRVDFHRFVIKDNKTLYVYIFVSVLAAWLYVFLNQFKQFLTH